MGNAKGKACAACGEFTKKVDRLWCKACGAREWGPRGTSDELEEWWASRV